MAKWIQVLTCTGKHWDYLGGLLLETNIRNKNIKWSPVLHTHLEVYLSYTVHHLTACNTIASSFSPARLFLEKRLVPTLKCILNEFTNYRVIKKDNFLFFEKYDNLQNLLNNSAWYLTQNTYTNITGTPQKQLNTISQWSLLRTWQMLVLQTQKTLRTEPYCRRKQIHTALGRKAPSLLKSRQATRIQSSRCKHTIYPRNALD